MARPTLRRLTLADLAILVAATAFGLVGSRAVRERRLEVPIYADFPVAYAWGMDSAPFLISASVALLVARSIGPRPFLRRCSWQPGTIACLMIVGNFARNAGEQAVLGLLKSSFGGATYWWSGDLQFLVLAGWYGGIFTAACWLTLVLSGRWRPEPSWIDRSGRVLGVVAFLGALALQVIP